MRSEKRGIYLIGASKKDISAHQLHRMLGFTYRAAWFMAHRLRYAMESGRLMTPLVAKGAGFRPMRAARRR